MNWTCIVITLPSIGITTPAWVFLSLKICFDPKHVWFPPALSQLLDLAAAVVRSHHDSYVSGHKYHWCHDFQMLFWATGLKTTRAKGKRTWIKYHLKPLFHNRRLCPWILLIKGISESYHSILLHESSILITYYWMLGIFCI